jgi:hypothetical protein
MTLIKKRKLELDLENAIKKVSHRGVTDRLHSPMNKTPTSTTSASATNRRANSVPLR